MTSAATLPNMAATYARWDQLLDSRDTAHHETLRKEMLQASETTSSADVELWWRLAALTNAMFLNMDSLSDEEIRADPAPRLANALQAQQYAQRALSLAPGRFEANLEMADALCNELYVKSCEEVPDVEAILHLFKRMNDHLRVCSVQQSNHYLVLLLESEMHAMFSDYEDHPEVGRILPNWSQLDDVQMEAKLVQAITIKPDFFILHNDLFMNLVNQDRVEEAMQVGYDALQVERKNKMENYVAELIEKQLQAMERRFPDASGDRAEVVSDSEDEEDEEPSDY